MWLTCLLLSMFAATHIKDESLCYMVSSAANLATFPSMTISLRDDVTLTVPPERLFVNMVWDQGAYCLSMYSNGGSGAVLGANVMMGNDVVFDLASRRIGFADSDCSLSNAARGVAHRTIPS